MTYDNGFGQGGGGGRGGGINLRWIIAAIIAIGSIVAYYGKTTINPVTGEKQRVDMTPQQEIALGVQSAPRMAAEMHGEVDPRDPMAQLVQRVGQRVLQHSDAARGPYTPYFRYHLLADDQTVNAFALPGGQVFITRALLVRLENEAELAGVLGHETGHVIERHSSQQLAKSKLGAALVSAVAVANSDRRDSGYSALMIANVVNQMKQLSFSREDETQADTCGLRYMSEAGYDPRAMLGVMKILQRVTDEHGGRPPEMLQTHPYPEHRLRTIEAWLRENFAQGVPSNLTLGARLERGRE